MPSASIVFGNQQATGDAPLAGAPELAYNVVTDGAGAVRRRPGIVAYTPFDEAEAETPYSDALFFDQIYDMSVTGIDSFDGQPVWVAGKTNVVPDKPYSHIWTINDDGIYDFAQGTASGMARGEERPRFAQTQFRLIIVAGGGAGFNPGTTIASGVAATWGSTYMAGQIAALAQRLFINDTTSTTTRNRIHYTGVGSAGNLTFGALSFTSAEARPDSVLALRENSNELFVFGERSLQVFVPDGQTILAPQRTINRGCAAAHSVVQANEHYGWLDEQRQIIVSDGRDIDEVSAPIAGTLDAIDTVSDCYGFRVNTDQFDLMNWHFPTDGRMFSYQKGSGWSQWSTWDVDYGHVAPDITAHYYWPEENLHLVGREDGSICQLSTSAYTDMGETIKAEVTTGFINHGTDAKKFTDALHLTFKRGQTATGSTEPLILLSWRDDYGTWGTPRQIGLGTVGDYVVTKTLRSLGGYRRRQWKLEFTHDAELVLASVTEDFTVGSA